jgi:hypothetical protein
MGATAPDPTKPGGTFGTPDVSYPAYTPYRMLHSACPCCAPIMPKMRDHAAALRIVFPMDRRFRWIGVSDGSPYSLQNRCLPCPYEAGKGAEDARSISLRGECFNFSRAPAPGARAAIRRGRVGLRRGMGRRAERHAAGSAAAGLVCALITVRLRNPAPQRPLCRAGTANATMLPYVEGIDRGQGDVNGARASDGARCHARRGTGLRLQLLVDQRAR